MSPSQSWHPLVWVTWMPAHLWRAWIHTCLQATPMHTRGLLFSLVGQQDTKHGTSARAQMLKGCIGPVNGHTSQTCCMDAASLVEPLHPPSSSGSLCLKAHGASCGCNLGQIGTFPLLCLYVLAAQPRRFVEISCSLTHSLICT